MFCIYCGKEIEDDVKVCPYCNKNLVEEEEQAKEQPSEEIFEEPLVTGNVKSTDKVAKKVDFKTVAIIASVMLAVVVAGVMFFVETPGKKARHYREALDAYTQYRAGNMNSRAGANCDSEIVLDNKGKPCLFMSFVDDSDEVESHLYGYDSRKKEVRELGNWNDVDVCLYTDGLVTVETTDKEVYQIRGTSLVKVAKYDYAEDILTLNLKDEDRGIAAYKDGTVLCDSEKDNVKDMLRYLYGTDKMYTDIWKARYCDALVSDVCFASPVLIITENREYNVRSEFAFEDMVSKLKENPVYTAKDLYVLYTDEVYKRFYYGYEDVAYRDKDWLNNMACINDMDVSTLQETLKSISGAYTDYLYESKAVPELGEITNRGSWQSAIGYLVEMRALKTDENIDNVTFFKEYEKWLSSDAFQTSYQESQKIMGEESPLLGYWQGIKMGIYIGYNTASDDEGFIIYQYKAGDLLEIINEGSYCSFQRAEKSIRFFDRDKNGADITLMEDGTIRYSNIDMYGNPTNTTELTKGEFSNSLVSSFSGTWCVWDSDESIEGKKIEITYDTTFHLTGVDDNANYRYVLYDGAGNLCFLDPIKCKREEELEMYICEVNKNNADELEFNAAIWYGGGGYYGACYREGSEKAALYDVYNAYKSYIASMVDSFEKYEFLYIDEDDIPELLMEDEDGAGVLLVYNNGSVDSGGVYFYGTGIYYGKKKGKVAYCIFDNDGGSINELYHIENGAIKYDGMGSVYISPDSSVSYTLDYEEVSKKKYKKFEKKLDELTEFCCPAYDDIYTAFCAIN